MVSYSYFMRISFNILRHPIFWLFLLLAHSLLIITFPSFLCFFLSISESLSTWHFFSLSFLFFFHSFSFSWSQSLILVGAVKHIIRYAWFTYIAPGIAKRASNRLEPLFLSCLTLNLQPNLRIFGCYQKQQCHMFLICFFLTSSERKLQVWDSSWRHFFISTLFLKAEIHLTKYMFHKILSRYISQVFNHIYPQL